MAKQPTDQIMISAQVERRLRDELAMLADQNERSFSAELRIALREYVLAAYASGALATEEVTA